MIQHFIKKQFLRLSNASPKLGHLIKNIVKIYCHFQARFGPNSHTLDVTEECQATFIVATYDEARHFYPFYGELPLLRMLIDELREDDIFYDVGGHIGIHSCIAAQAVVQGEVHTFEPHPKNINRIKENRSMNGFDKVISVHPVGLGTSNREIEISLDRDEAGAMGHIDSDAREVVTTAHLRTGESYIEENDLPKPTVMKIDVEGAELEVLKGMADMMDNCRAIFCEVSEHLHRYGSDEDELLEFLKERGFNYEFIERKSEQCSDIKAIR